MAASCHRRFTLSRMDKSREKWQWQEWEKWEKWEQGSRSWDLCGFAWPRRWEGGHCSGCWHPCWWGGKGGEGGVRGDPGGFGEGLEHVQRPSRSLLGGHSWQCLFHRSLPSLAAKIERDSPPTFPQRTFARGLWECSQQVKPNIRMNLSSNHMFSVLPTVSSGLGGKYGTLSIICIVEQLATSLEALILVFHHCQWFHNLLWSNCVIINNHHLFHELRQNELAMHFEKNLSLTNCVHINIAKQRTAVISLHWSQSDWLCGSEKLSLYLNMLGLLSIIS